MTEYDNLLFEIEDQIAWLTLNRPDKRNSFTRKMHEELRAALSGVEHAIDRDRGVRVLVVTGRGKGFSAGQDLSERQRQRDDEPPPDLTHSLRENYNPLIMRLTDLPIPVIAAVNGVAAGAGANLAFACDLVVAARSASFIQPFCNIGLIPDGGGTWMLPRLVGMARAKGLTFLGERISAEQAEQWGLIWRTVEDAELLPVVKEMARQLASRPWRGFELQKRAYSKTLEHGLSEQLDYESELQGIAGRTDAYREAIARFFEKRKGG